MLWPFPQKLLYRNCVIKWTFHMYKMQNPVNSEYFHSYTVVCIRFSNRWVAGTSLSRSTYTHAQAHTHIYTHRGIYIHTQYIYSTCTHTKSNLWHFLGKKMNWLVHGLTRSMHQKKSNFSAYFWGCSCMSYLTQSNSVLPPEEKIVPTHSFAPALEFIWPLSGPIQPIKLS